MLSRSLQRQGATKNTETPPLLHEWEGGLGFSHTEDILDSLNMKIHWSIDGVGSFPQIHGTVEEDRKLWVLLNLDFVKTYDDGWREGSVICTEK